MVSITDNLKEGLKYPLYEPKKVGILGALYFIITFIVLGAGHIFFSSIKNIAPTAILENATAVSANSTTVLANNTIVANSTAISTSGSALSGNIFSMISPVSSAEAIILLIIALIISLFVTGYLFRVIEFTVDGKNTLPEFNEFLNMLISGIKVVIVGFVYSIIPSILGIVGLSLSSNPSGIISGIGFIILIIAIILGIILGLMEIMAINNMAANNGSLRSAFEFKNVCHLICSIGWIRFIGAIIFLILVGAILIFVVAVISIVLMLICSLAGEIGTYIGIVLMAILVVLVTSYLQIVTFRYYGALYNEAIKK